MWMLGLDWFVDVHFMTIIEFVDDASSVMTRLVSILMLLPMDWQMMTCKCFLLLFFVVVVALDHSDVEMWLLNSNNVIA